MNRLKPEVKDTVASYFARVQLNNARRLGLDIDELLSRSRLSAKLLADPQARIAPEQLALLFSAIWETCGDEYFGLTEKASKVGIFTLAGEHMIGCNTLGQALKQACRFYRLMDRGVVLRLERSKDTVSLVITLSRPELDPNYVLTELLLLVWHRFPSWLVAEVIPLLEIHFTYPAPEQAQEYRLLYPGPCQFEQPDNRLVWPAEVLDWPIRRNTNQLGTYMREVPLQWFKKQRYVENLTDQVTRLLEESATEHLISIEDIAIKLNMTSRTLRRRLTAEGVSYQTLKDTVRKDRAIYWLSQEDVPIAQVSRYCGYTETAAFIRAFKKWTDMSPGDYRKRLLHPR